MRGIQLFFFLQRLYIPERLIFLLLFMQSHRRAYARDVIALLKNPYRWSLILGFQAPRYFKSQHFLLWDFSCTGTFLVKCELNESRCFGDQVAELFFLASSACYFVLEQKSHCLCLLRAQPVSSPSSWIHQHSLTNKETGSMLDTNFTRLCSLSLCNPSVIDKQNSGTWAAVTAPADSVYQRRHYRPWP